MIKSLKSKLGGIWSDGRARSTINRNKTNKQAPEQLMITNDSAFNSISCLFHPLGKVALTAWLPNIFLNYILPLALKFPMKLLSSMGETISTGCTA